MDDLGFNKIAGAVLATALGFMVLTKLPSIVMSSPGEEIAYKVGSFDAAGAEEEIEQPFPQADWVAAMDATKGAKIFKKCTSCHNNEAGGANGIGPNLYGVVGNDIGTHAGFAFSTAMTGLDGNWDFEALDEYLTKPSAYAPDTKMIFVGLKKAEDRAAVIEYLRVADSAPTPRPAAKDPIVATEAVAEAPEGAPEETVTATEDMPEATETPETTEPDAATEGPETVVGEDSPDAETPSTEPTE